jgi:hypothetical protein
MKLGMNALVAGVTFASDNFDKPVSAKALRQTPSAGFR